MMGILPEGGARFLPIAKRKAVLAAVIVGAVAIIGALAFVLRSKIKLPAGVAPAGLSEERIAAITAICYDPANARYDELQKNAPPAATDGVEFVRGLEQLPFFAAIFSERDTRYEDANTKDPALLAQEGKASTLQFTDLALEVATCYERELARFPAARAAAALVAELHARGAALEATDFAPFYTTGDPAEAVLTLAPKEEKTARLRTLCIDRFAQPPPAGTTYILYGTADALMKPELCGLLRGAARHQARTLSGRRTPSGGLSNSARRRGRGEKGSVPRALQIISRPNRRAFLAGCSLH